MEHEKEFSNLRDPGDKISELDIIVKEGETTNVLSFKTPGKKKGNLMENQLVVDRPGFSKLFSDEQPFIE